MKKLFLVLGFMLVLSIVVTYVQKGIDDLKKRKTQEITELKKTADEIGKEFYSSSNWKEARMEGLAKKEKAKIKSNIAKDVGGLAREDGEYLEKYDSGRVKTKAFIKNSLYEGEYKNYYESGQLKLEKFYVNGRVEGVVIFYYESGKVLGETSFKNDKMEGVHKTYYESGQIKDEDFFKDYKNEGLNKSYYEDGKMRVEGFYVNGKIEGERKTYYSDGKIKELYVERAGNPISIKMFSPTGRIIEERRF